MKGLLEVLDEGLFTTIQDAGRYGYRQYGIPVPGVMDSHAYRLANWLAGNSFDVPVLEMTLKGGSYRFHSDAVIGISGADMRPQLNEKPMDIKETIRVEKGDVIKFSFAQKGCRTYLAIYGSWKIEKVMGSCSTYCPAALGGLEGRKLRRGDVLEWDQKPTQLPKREIPLELIPYFSAVTHLRLIAGPEWSSLPRKDQQRFLKTEFRTAPQSDRMGVRLKSNTLFKVRREEIVSSAVIPGTIQLVGRTSPIILMKDGQTAGGYPRIAKITDADLWRVGQLAPHQSVTFKMISRDEAIALSEYRENLYETLAKS